MNINLHLIYPIINKMKNSKVKAKGNKISDTLTGKIRIATTTIARGRNISGTITFDAFVPSL